MISVIIPAFNEENVIISTLEALQTGADIDQLEIIVVCNGCTDGTVAIVQAFEPRVKCIETPTPSKSSALNIGDSAASHFPRIYQDADVTLSTNSVFALAKALQDEKHLAVAPIMKMLLDNSTWAVRSYYKIWQLLPYVQEGMIGTGVYALSETGKNRVGLFPDIIADDGYVRAQFKSSERFKVTDAESIVRAPVNLCGLLKIKTRSRLGRYELNQKFPELKKNEEKVFRPLISFFLRRINLWPELSIYLYVNIMSRILARNYFRGLGYTGWQRDITSRDI